MQDLTHSLTSETPTHPGDPPVELHAHATHDRDGYRVTAVSFGSHAGTHVDAPAHVDPDGATLDAFPIERFSFDTRLVDLCPVSDGERIGVDALPPVDCDLLLLRTGWDAHWGTDRYADHPVVTPEAAAWCADRGCDLALDAPSPDPRDSTELPAHHALLGADRLLIENLTNLGGLPRRFRLHAYPLALGDVDGAPVRAVADV
jgi:kynurenine formamidase